VEGPAGSGPLVKLLRSGELGERVEQPLAVREEDGAVVERLEPGRGGTVDESAGRQQG